MADVALVVTGKTLAHCHSGVRRFMEHPGGALDRSRDHNSFFSLDKFGLLNCKARVAMLGPALQLVNGKKIAPADPHRFLGVVLDHRLRFTPHVNYALPKRTR